MADSGAARRDPSSGDGFAYLLVQLGFHLAGKFAERLAPLGLELEQRGLVERRRNPADRRSYALYLTDQGRAKLREAQEASAGHAGQVGVSLTDEERARLTTLLRRLADEQGITGTSLPGPPPWAR